MLFSKNKSQEHDFNIRIVFIKEYYEIHSEKINELLTEGDLIKNLFYYEGVFQDEDIIKIHESAIHEIEPIILEEINIFKFNGLIKIDKNGIIQVSEVKFNHKFMRNSTSQIHCEKIEDLLKIDNLYYLIGDKQANLIKDLKEYNTDSEKNKSAQHQFHQIKKIKESINQNEIARNNDFNAYNPVIVDKISLEVIPTSDTEITVKPKLLGDAKKFNEQFNDVFNSSQKINQTYPVDGNTFLVIDEEKQESLNKLKDYKKIKGKKEISDFLDSVELILPGIEYSERLLGWGEYKLSNLRGDSNNLIWINEVDEAGTSKKKIKYKTDSGENLDIPEDIDLHTLKERISNATSEGQKEVTIPIEGTPKLIVADAHKLYENILMVQEQIFEGNRVREPIKKNNEFVLIKTDFEDLEYEEVSKIVKLDNGEMPNHIKESNWDLFDYQKEGLFWLEALFNSMLKNPDSKAIGGLLADDMGLGKTMQILTFLSWLKEKGELNKALIIVPVTLINNWSSSRLIEEGREGEIEKYFNGVFNPLPIRTKNDLLHINDDSFDLVIASYDIVMSQAKSESTFRSTFGLIDWDFIACDEAQKIKNPSAKRTVAVKSLKGKFKIACTATPIENHMDELWSICDWVIPGTLGSLAAFRKKYITQKANTATIVHDELASKLHGYYMRRTKGEVLKDKLKEKRIHVYQIPITKEQKAVYSDLIRSYDGSNILPLIGKMIGVMTHKDFLTNSITEIDVESLENGSNKFTWIREILTEIKNNNEKALIFTPSKWIQRALKKYIDTVFSINSVIVNGDVKGNLRLREIESVKKLNGFGVLILSPEVAGYGLTITQANHVIHFSRGWNPAKENQATDRAYRIGQKKDVTVYIPIVSFDRSSILETNFDTNEDYYNWNYPIEKVSPEENLDILMRKKGSLLNNFFSVASSISTNELFDTFVTKETDDDSLKLSELIETLNPDQFEGFCALIFEKKGYSVTLTPYSGDLGVDVVVHDYSEGKPLLIQVNKTKLALNQKKVQEVVSAKITYERALSNKCILGVFTNSNTLGRTTEKLARDNNLYIFDGKGIMDLAAPLDIKYAEVIARSSQREAVVYS